jgi:hypothetical protein
MIYDARHHPYFIPVGNSLPHKVKPMRNQGPVFCDYKKDPVQNFIRVKVCFFNVNMGSINH